MEWYYYENDKQIGPVTEEELLKLADEGRITSESYVWNNTMADWTKYSEVSVDGAKQEPETLNLTGAVSETAVDKEFCNECGKRLPVDELIRLDNKYICAECKPLFVQKIKEGESTAVSGHYVYGGFWIRFGAKAIDGIILWVLNMLMSVVFTGAAVGSGKPNTGLLIGTMLVNLLIPFLYSTLLVGKYGATLGKMACGLRIITAEGEKVSYLRALGRAAAEILSGMILYIGYIMAAFDDEKRTLHDRICNTRVIKK